jgi:hypothetical protein
MLLKLTTPNVSQILGPRLAVKFFLHFAFLDSFKEAQQLVRTAMHVIITRNSNRNVCGCRFKSRRAAPARWPEAERFSDLVPMTLLRMKRENTKPAVDC